MRRWGLFALVAGAAIACGPNAGAQGESSSTAAGSSSDGTGTTTSSDVPEGWPSAWFGTYYWVGDNITLGVPSQSEPDDTFYNVVFALDGVAVEHFDATGERMGTFTSTPTFDAGVAIVSPPPGETYLDIPPAAEGKARAEISADGDVNSCDTMTMRIVYREDTTGPAFTDYTLRRARICLIEALQQDTLLIDFCPDELPMVCTSN